MMIKKPPESEPNIDFERLCKRDKNEIVRWFDSFADSVYGFIYYRVGRDPDLANEAAQETFVTALESIDRFDPERGDMFPWLTYIARNCIRKVLRRQSRISDIADFWKTVDHGLIKRVTDLEAGIIPEEVLQQKQTAELVRIALTNLSLRYQVALRRRYFEDLSLHEMAVLEKSTEEAMKVLLHRARQAFREAFETISASFIKNEGKGRVIS
jgi:RNA polymerase sigma-70 factor (ECF subfamily)